MSRSVPVSARLVRSVIYKSVSLLSAMANCLIYRSHTGLTPVNAQPNICSSSRNVITDSVTLVDCASKPGSLDELFEEIRSAMVLSRFFAPIRRRSPVPYDSDDDDDARDSECPPSIWFDSVTELVVVSTRRFYEGGMLSTINRRRGRTQFIPPITLFPTGLKMSESLIGIPRSFKDEKTWSSSDEVSTSQSDEEPTRQSDEDLFIFTWDSEDLMPQTRRSDENTLWRWNTMIFCPSDEDEIGVPVDSEEAGSDAVDESGSDAVEETVSSEPKKPKHRSFLSTLARGILSAGIKLFRLRQQ